MPAPVHLSSGIARTAFAWALRLLLAVAFLAGMLILAGRHWLMPEIAARPELVAEKLSAAIGLPVRIDALSAEWPGLHPRLAMEGLQIFDRAGRPALSFERVTAEVGWSSLWHFGLRLRRLEIDAPQLEIRRDPQGKLFVAGLPVESDSEGSFADWLLAQRRIIVRDARLAWHDELRGAPPFELQQLNFELHNAGSTHRFGLTATPPQEVAALLDLRGELQGNDPGDLAAWRGELFADLVQADMTAWRPWFDLPLEWLRGRGGVRVWFQFADLQPLGLTADLGLIDVAVRLRPGLPPLVLERLSGRVAVKRDSDGVSGEVKQLALATGDGIVLAPTNAHLRYAHGGRGVGGAFAANQLDIGVLAALAGHLPLPSGVRAQLESFAPRGRLADLELSWDGSAEAPDHWQAKGRFDNLALASHKELPGFAGISGRIEGDDRAGKAWLDSRDVRIVLPGVFADPVLELAQLEAEGGWRARGDAVELQLARAAFRNDDADGEAAGSYLHTGRGLGEIDLAAKLTRAAASAVWRYMPLGVNQEVRDWLRASLREGESEHATLRLKGPLAEFPFHGGKGGIFQVKGAIRAATLDYAPNWPRITDIDGELLFEGARMAIHAQRGTIMNVALADVRAEIADLDAAGKELLVVTGQAQGETQRFLDFIEASPVGARIDHFTRPLVARGRGALELQLDLPLQHIADTQVQGRYRFADNVLRLQPGVPQLTAAQGELSFTAASLQTSGLRARLLGAPVSIAVTTEPGGALRVEAAGKLTAQGLRQEYDLRALDHLSGEASWRGSVLVQRQAAEVRLDASLDSLSSSLPEPFNKPANAPLPLKVTGRIEAGHGDWQLQLDDIARARVQQAGDDWRGRIALGDLARNPLPDLPERGIVLSAAQPVVDLDAWHAALAGSGGAAGGPFPLTAVDLRGETVIAMHRPFNAVRVAGRQSDGRWRFEVDSLEARGRLGWDGSGAGRITGHLTHLELPASVQLLPEAEDGAAADSQTLPAIELAIDSVRLRDMMLGAVRVNAENLDGIWLAQLEVENADARLTGRGMWRPSRSNPESALNFRLDIENIERLLARLGLPDAVRRGDGVIEGDVSWAGGPFSIDVPSLSGKLRAEIGKGQFKQVEPGVGRLLGVLSLQSLPRRISLDFRDIFSSGFAFDGIVGTAQINRGMLGTQELRIGGPAAKILLSGQANLVAETQDLKVRIQPAVGETVAVGTMLANPVAGVIAWLAQKVLDDPLDQAFAYEYAVTGPWGDPKVTKIEMPKPQQPSVPTP